MKKILIILPLAMIFLSGCVINIKTAGGVDGGVFKSVNAGDNWEQIALIYRVGELEKTFKAVDVATMAMDPTDSQAIYIGTKDQGMYYTYNGGIGWHQALTNLGKINAISVSPKERCIIYVAIANRLYKSLDCNRHWDYQLIETREDPNNQITAIDIDAYNPSIIYVGTSGKGFFRSEDAGLSWHAIKFFDDRINKVLVNPSDTRIIYVATANKGLFKTSDRGVTWQELFSKEMVKEKKNLLVYRQMILDPTAADGLLYASQYGLLRSQDGSKTWEDIKLLTPPSTTYIYSLGIDPKNGQWLYYGTDKALFRSEDGGKNWITRNLPTTRASRFLIINPSEPNVLYMGVESIK